MGREVRRVPATWQHPKINGKLAPLYDGYEKAIAQWEAAHEKWLGEEHEEDESFEDWEGPQPKLENYMPDWPEAERTHFQLYETTTEGTPISPVFATMDELIDYAAENCTTFASFTATREQWAKMLGDGLVFHSVGSVMFI